MSLIEQPQTFIAPTAYICCDRSGCTTRKWHTQALMLAKKTNKEDITLYFCGEACANEYFLEQLRRAGL